MIDIPASTGFGEPIQKLFKLKDGEHIVSALSLDPRVVGNVFADPKQPDYCPDAEIIGVYPIDSTETVLAISAECRAVICPVEDINYLSGAGKGVMLIKLAKSDRLLGFKPSKGDRDLLVVETNRGAKKTISTAKYRTTSRGGKGNEIQKNGKIEKIIWPPIESPGELKPLKKS
jgi:DNA gyrase subunit A